MLTGSALAVIALIVFTVAAGIIGYLIGSENAADEVCKEIFPLSDDVYACR